MAANTRRRAKSARRTRKKSAAKSSATARASAAHEKERSEFVIVRVGQGLKIGGQVRVMGVASTLDEAKKQIEKMDDSSARNLAILEKRQLVERRPAITTRFVSGNLIGSKS